MPKPSKTWVLVADGGRARVLEARGPKRGFDLVLEREVDLHRNAELGTDRPGRSYESVGGARHAHVDNEFHREEERAFLRGLATTLDAERVAGRFDRLVVVAPPVALGDLRKLLSEPLRAALSGEINKDLTKVALHDLPGHLRGDVPC